MIRKFLRSDNLKRLADIRNVGLYIFSIIVLAITWNGAKTVQTNYELQKKISVLNQQNAVLGLQNDNIRLKNQYLQTNEYLDLAARQNLGLAGPGEKISLVPKDVAMKYVVPASSSASAGDSLNTSSRPAYIRNLEDWRDFLLGRKLFSD